MLTIFAIPKAFNGKVVTAQRNSIQSWLRLHPDVEVILFGEDDGVAEVCREFGIGHGGNIPVWKSGVPLLGEVFRRVDAIAKHRLICHVTADTVLTSGLVRAVRSVSHLDKFLLIGRRYDQNITEPLDFEDPNWEGRLRGRGPELARIKGNDYFVYPKGFWGNVPPFIMGRPFPDSWLVYRARQLRHPVIDGTSSILAVHHVHETKGRNSPGELAWNRKLAGVGVYFNTDDATHVLSSCGIQPMPRSWSKLMRSIDSDLLIKWPRLYSVLSLARFRRTGLGRHILFAPWRMIRKALGIS